MVKEGETPTEPLPLVPPSQRSPASPVPTDKRVPYAPKTEAPPGVVADQVFERIRKRRGK